MANALYDAGRNAFLLKLIDWVADDIRALPVRTAGGGGGPYYVLDLANHDFLDDVPNNGDCRPVAAQLLDAKTADGTGVADASDEVFAAFPAGDAVQGVILYLHTGVEATSNLIAWIDSGTNLPFTPNGGDITVQWDAGANKIFKL